MANIITRVENFALTLGATNDHIERVITPFVQMILSDIVKDRTITLKDVLNSDVYSESWNKDLADAGVYFGLTYPEGGTEAEFDVIFEKISSRSDRLYGYIIAMLGM